MPSGPGTPANQPSLSGPLPSALPVNQPSSSNLSPIAPPVNRRSSFNPSHLAPRFKRPSSTSLSSPSPPFSLSSFSPSSDPTLTTLPISRPSGSSFQSRSRRSLQCGQSSWSSQPHSNTPYSAGQPQYRNPVQQHPLSPSVYSSSLPSHSTQQLPSCSDQVFQSSCVPEPAITKPPLSSPHVPTIDLSLSDEFECWEESDSDYITSYSVGDHEWNRPTPNTHFDDVSGYSGNEIALSPEPPTFSSSVASSRSVSPSQTIPPISFSTPPKLKTVEQVMNENTGTDAASLRRLTTALAREAIFGKEEMARKSLTGRNSTGELDREKVDYIRTLVHSRVPKKQNVEFESMWKWCRGSLSKSCQTLRNSLKKKGTY